MFFPQKGSFLPNLLKISNVFLAIEAASSHNFVHNFSTRYDFPKKGPFFPKNRFFFGKCWENDCAAPRPFLPLHRQFEARVAHDGKLTK